MSNKRPLNILIVKNRAMGDAVMGLAAVQYAKVLFPKANIYYAVPTWVSPLFKNTQTAADQIIDLNLSTLKNCFQLYKKIKKLKLDFIFELFQSGRTSKFFYLFSKINKTKYLFHNHHNYKNNESNIQRDLNGLWSEFAKNNNINKPNYLNYKPTIKLKKNNKNIFNKTIVFGVVATRTTKMWPLQNYVKLAKLIKFKYPNYDIIIPLSNSKIDNLIKKKLLDKNIEAQIVHLPLEKLPELFSSSEIYIGNDTGLKHIAVSINIKSFTLFGPESPIEWHPYETKDHPFFFKKDLECRTRSAHFCGLKTCESMICLNDFSVDMVFEKISTALYLP